MSGDIELEIGAGERPGCYEVRVVRSAGGGEPSGRLIVDIAEILARHRELETAVLASSASVRHKVTSVEQPVREVGQRLFEALFNGPVYGAYRASLGAVQQGGERLRVVLRLTAPELAALPWEALFDPETQAYLCRKEPLVRHVPAPYTQPPLEIRPPLRILGLVASPRGMPVLDVETEQQNLETALAQPIADGLVELVWMHQASWEAIHSKLLGGEWHVLHFIGHGDYDADADEGVLYLVGADGRAKGVEASRLTDLLGEARPPLRLVVLNSCSSGESGSQDLFSGTAAVLAHNGIDGVAAMQYSITDTAAIAFARGFYTALAHGLTVDEAARSGRVEILGIGHTLEWVTPVLYVRRDLTRPFIITRKPPVAEPSPPASETADSTAKPHRLPGLHSTRRARRPRLRRRAFPVSRKRLAVIAGAVICAAGALAAAVLLHRSTPPSAPSPSVLFRDNFSTAVNEGNWTEWGDGNNYQYGNGKYQIYVSPGNGNWAMAQLQAPGLDPAPSNIVIEVSARLIAGTGDFDYGIACRSNSSATSDYEFEILGNTIRIVKYVSSNQTTLAQSLFTATPATGANQLRAECTSAGNAVHLTFWANGTELAATDRTNPIASGMAGLSVENYSTTGTVEVQYENFVVTRT